MCDSMIASKKVTRCGYHIFGKNSDRSPNEPQPMVYIPAADHAAGSTVRATQIEVEQAAHTYAVILSKPSWIWGGEIGINEKGVVIGNEAVISRDMDKDAKALLGMDILRIALERAATAKEAVQVIGEMMERYGQGGNCSFDGIFYYDNAYLIADSDEIWHVETAGQHKWVARKVEEPGYSISNYISINYPDLMHKDIVAHAREAGYDVEDPFDFAKAYAYWDNLGSSGMLRRCCSFQQMMRPGRNFRLADMLTALRSHNCNDEWTEAMHCVCMHAQNPQYPSDVDCQTTNSMIAVMKPGDNLILAPGMSTPCIAPFQPFWFDAYSSKQVFGYDRMEEGVEAWLKREAINRAAIDGRLPVKDYRDEMHAMEKRWIEGAEKISRSDRQAFVDANADEMDAFIEKWAAICAREKPAPRGTVGFQKWWGAKNEALGKDRRLAR